MIRSVATFVIVATLTSSAMPQSSELPSFPPEVQRMMDEFNNRKKYSDFDLETLRSIKDEHLEQAILDYVFAKLDAQPDQPMTVISGLSPGFQAFYIS